MTSKMTTNKYCKLCHDIGKPPDVYLSHFPRINKNKDSKITCPTILSFQCTFCHQKGHSVKYCSRFKKSSLSFNEKQKKSFTKNTLKLPNLQKKQISKKHIINTHHFTLLYNSSSDESDDDNDDNDNNDTTIDNEHIIYVNCDNNNTYDDEEHNTLLSNNTKNTDEEHEEHDDDGKSINIIKEEEKKVKSIFNNIVYRKRWGDICEESSTDYDTN